MIRFSFLLWLSLPITALAVPMNLTNQGYLQDSEGQGLKGAHELTFSLYDDSAANNPALWTETITVDFVAGAYSAILGDTVPVDEELLEQYPLFLGLSVDGAGDMTPRHELLSIPYAILAETSFNVSGGTVDATSVTVGDTVIDSDGISVDGTIVIDGSGAFVGAPPPLADLGCQGGQHLIWKNASGVWACADESDPDFAASASSSIQASDVNGWHSAVGWGDHGVAGYLTSYTETDPEYAASTAAGIVSADVDNWNGAAGWGDHSAAGYLTSVTESDPEYSASTAAGIVSADVDNWNGAYGWGDHSAAGYLTSVTESDPEYSASAAADIDAGDVTGWNVAAGWGDHSKEGYLISYTESDPEYSASAAAGIGTADIDNWNEAFNRGDNYVESDTGDPVVEPITQSQIDAWNANAGVSESDPFFTASTAAGIDAGDVADWNTAVGWGDHGSAGYITGYSETDPSFTASTAAGIDAGDVADWNAAVGWGDHGSEGYITGYSETDPSFTASTAAGIDAGDVANWNTAYNRVDQDTTYSASGNGITLSSGVFSLSTDIVSRNADTLDGQNGSYYLNAANLTGTVGTGLFSAYSDLSAEGKIGTSAAQVAAGNHDHDQDYAAAAHSHGRGTVSTYYVQSPNEVGAYGGIASACCASKEQVPLSGGCYPAQKGAPEQPFTLGAEQLSLIKNFPSYPNPSYPGDGYDAYAETLPGWHESDYSACHTCWFTRSDLNSGVVLDVHATAMITCQTP